MSKALAKSKLAQFKLFFEELPKEAPHERMTDEVLKAQERSPVLPVKRLSRTRK